ncbi:MAG: basic amino acid ABC transporter substrate-binding protein [Desulfobulbaceae bacterium]|nr:basic amino acid ABC transporter substrate-binding protein [Desulfobulbaceae bacterium]
MITRFITLIVSFFASIFMLCQPVVAAEKTIVFASDATWPPMEFVDEQKNLVGYAIDMVHAIAKEAGFKAEIKNTAWDGIFAGLAAGKYDAIASSVSITEDRKKSMDFSEPYYTVRQALIVRKDSNATTLDDLKGQKVGGQIGTTGYFTIKNASGLEAKSYDEIGLAMEDLNVGRLAAVVCDDPVAANYALKRYKDSLKIVQIIEGGEVEQYGFAVNKGNDETLELLNRGLSLVKEKGIDKELQLKWIGQ